MPMPLETIETDVVIVGGGPAGCSCALYTSRADLRTVILDKNPDVGALAITHQIANYPGVSSEMSGEALLKLMRDQRISSKLQCLLQPSARRTERECLLARGRKHSPSETRRESF